MSRGRALVIGRGVIGSSVALALARDGWTVTALDRHGVAGHGSTSASSGVIRTHYSTREGSALAWEGYHVWRDLAAALDAPPEGLARFRETGCLVMAHAGNDGLRRQREIADDLGIPWEWWTGDAIRTRLPHLDLRQYGPPRRPDAAGFGEPTGGSIEGGVFWPNAGYVADPMLAAQNIWDAAARHGAEARRGKVTGFRIDGRVRAALLKDGEAVEADIVVNAAGPASSGINAMAGADLDMGVHPRPLRQEVVHLPPPPGLDGSDLGPVVSDGDAGVYSRPERAGMLIGSEEPPCDPMVWVEDPNRMARDFTDQWDVQAMRYGQRVPKIGIPTRRSGVVECYDATEDFIPIYDRSCVPGFYMACGTSGNQFKTAPVVGTLMAAIIAHVESGGNQDADPVQVEAQRTGLTLDTGFYSRLRSPNPESSGTVLG
ncbi:NAD(P)/FAD-dependent oxidoreductase [Jannaschia aquimarina]|uniref:Mlr_1 protein n=1 Tax=Jannaschia aquimarina TaxID=935700 RepID=A0A0D1DC07_9RHOB|nr:FAD-dependent oxidoreductase [Jannaschia aquimarina]KIT17548.1 4-methylaminobutanoate oxidase (formaldehyde-forming) [Jannaschia aquimarina]SNS73154.1 sarcosine oxidase subunit beta [Jannaschia aquimarina]